jgi:hypothetical protein
LKNRLKTIVDALLEKDGQNDRWTHQFGTMVKESLDDDYNELQDEVAAIQFGTLREQESERSFEKKREEGDEGSEESSVAGYTPASSGVGEEDEQNAGEDEWTEEEEDDGWFDFRVSQMKINGTFSGSRYDPECS